MQCHNDYRLTNNPKGTHSRKKAHHGDTFPERKQPKQTYYEIAHVQLGYGDRILLRDNETR